MLWLCLTLDAVHRPLTAITVYYVVIQPQCVGIDAARDSRARPSTSNTSASSKVPCDHISLLASAYCIIVARTGSWQMQCSDTSTAPGEGGVHDRTTAAPQLHCAPHKLELVRFPSSACQPARAASLIARQLHAAAAMSCAAMSAECSRYVKASCSMMSLHTSSGNAALCVLDDMALASSVCRRCCLPPPAAGKGQGG
jgi:hypothetical protein